MSELKRAITQKAKERQPADSNRLSLLVKAQDRLRPKGGKH